MILPQEYIIQKFYQYAGYPKHKKITNTYEAGCPICREGKSWLKKRRCYYVVDNNIICCHNCGWYSDPIKWIIEVSRQSYGEILNEIKTYDRLPVDIYKDVIEESLPENTHKLPLDCINLFDTHQVSAFEDTPIVKKTLEVIKARRLDTAVNRPKALWLSLTDRLHKNRLVIPFYNEREDIIFYQSRTIVEDSRIKLPKYLSKVNGEKALYNLDKLSIDLEYIFIFEGPIDAFFVRNGTAVAGINEKSTHMFSNLQQTQINSFKLHKRIWVLDSQWLDKASRQKTKILIDQGETVFIWPEKLGKMFKDINDACVHVQIDEISPNFIVNNSHQGLKAKLLLSAIV